jgi:hypothetical protein
MVDRGITVEEVRTVITEGEAIAVYPDDDPYPSCLLLGFVPGRPIHVVLAYDSTTLTGIVVTVYTPDPGLWTDDFRTRRDR